MVLSLKDGNGRANGLLIDTGEVFRLVVPILTVLDELEAAPPAPESTLS